MGRRSPFNFIERAWANVWQTLVWLPRDWYYSRVWTTADTVLLVLVMATLGILIGVAISYG